MNFLGKRLLHFVPNGKSVMGINYRKTNETYKVLTILLLAYDNLSRISLSANKLKVTDIYPCVVIAKKEAKNDTQEMIGQEIP
jgi:hypothetical protein